MWAIRAKVFRRGLGSVLPRISAFCTTQHHTLTNNLDLQIQELNQELQDVFGSNGNENNAIPFSDLTRSRTVSRSISCQSSAHLSQEASARSTQDLTHVGTHGKAAMVDVSNKAPTTRLAGAHLSEEASIRSTQELTHVDTHGKAAMVDVSNKALTTRVARASGRVLLGPAVFPLVSSNQISKGDVLTFAKLAGICGAKQTGSLIPLCHNITLSHVQVNIELDKEEQSALIMAEVKAVGATGVEMEALTAVSVAALTIYDMCKAVSKHISIGDIQLESKTGGKGGHWCRSQDSV